MTKKIVSYVDSERYCILVPVFYEYEDKPTWKKAFVGSKEECEKAFPDYPDTMQATYEENKQLREWKRQEYLSLLSHGKKKEAEAIKIQYKL